MKVILMSILVKVHGKIPKKDFLRWDSDLGSRGRNSLVDSIICCFNERW